MQQLPTHSGGAQQPKNQRGNVAAVEPYNHVPHAQSVNHNNHFQVSKASAESKVAKVYKDAPGVPA